jgi:hypothetical protein
MAIAVDGSGNAYITGYTQSTDFPAVKALQRHRSGSVDAFVTKINANGGGLAYSTYLGGRSDDLGLGIAVAPNGNAYVVGQTSSTGFTKVHRVPIDPWWSDGCFCDEDCFAHVCECGAADTLGFGQPLVGSESAAKKITVTNNKTSALTVRKIHLEGVNAADFAQVNTCPSSLAAGASCYAWVSFKPSAKGPRKGFLVINDADPASPQAVALSGSGTVVSLSPKTLAFGTQALGTTSAARTTILTNTGSAVLNVSGIGITGASAGDFVLSSDCGTSVSGGASCRIDVTKPTAAGEQNATVSISDDGGQQIHIK